MRKTIHRRRIVRGALLSSLLLTSSCFAATAPAHAAAPGPTIDIGDADVIEGDVGSNDLVFEVTLSSATGKVVTVDYGTGGGDATPGDDYQATSGTITFNKRETVKTVRVPVFGDEAAEPDETLVVTLRRPGGAELGDASGIGLIRDDGDVPPPPPSSTLTVSRAGEGAGAVTSSPEGIHCGATCAADFEDGTSVTLTATPSSGSTFAGWSGACAGTATTCTLSMDGDRQVTATFSQAPPVSNQLIVTVSQGGSSIGSVLGGPGRRSTGTVTSSPAGISCGGDCAEVYPAGTSVVLTANPGVVMECRSLGACTTPTTDQSRFVGWGGACSSFGTQLKCTVVMSEARAVTASFAP